MMGKQERTETKAERRQLTIMFCDLVGSTALSTQYDPEDMRALLTAYREACASAIRPFGGFVAQYSGDGILVYFGYPQAREHDAEYSIRAAQSIVTKLGGYVDPPLRVRIGIATGTVVVGDLVGDGIEEQNIAIGRTPNLAARLMSLAQPEAIVVCDSTQRLVADIFDYRELGETRLKGFDEPVRAWQVVGAARVKSFSHAIHTRSHATPLIAREDEVGRLANCWKLAREGQGQVVLVSGEAGIGKSRLTHHFESLLEKGREHCRIIRLYCSESGQNTVLRPVVDHIVLESKVTVHDREDEKLGKVVGFLRDVAGIPEEDVSLIVDFLSVNESTNPVNRNVSADVAKARAFETLESYFCERARIEPTLLVVEDLHWSDATTLELLERIVAKRVHDLPMMIALTARPPFAAPWPGEHFVTDIQLKRFSPAASAKFLESMPQADRLSGELRKRIIERSDRIPLFIEEVYKAVLENLALSERRDAGVPAVALDGVGVPSSLASSLMERLDRLGPVKTVAQHASALGQIFSQPILEDLGVLDPEELREALNRLELCDIISPRQDGAPGSYAFRHALVREAAYSSLLREERKRLHARIAQVLEERYPTTVQREPELLAHHCAMGGIIEKAIGYWRKAGERARERSANSDAVRHLSKGLELLSKLPATEVTRELEIDLRTSLALALTAIRGGGAAEVKENYARALALSRQDTQKPEMFTLMIGCWLNHFISGDLHSAAPLSEEILAFASRDNGGSYSIEANRIRGMTLFYVGDFAGARKSIRDALDLHDPDRHKLHALRFGLDPLVCCRSYLAYVELFLGHSERALQQSDEAIAAAEALQHPYTIAFSLAFAAFVRQNLEMIDAARELAGRAIRVATDNEFHFWATQQTVIRTWADARRDPSALPAMRRAVDAFLASGSLIGSTRMMSLMAEVLIETGEVDEAEAILGRAIKTADASGEMFYLPEIHRLSAVLASHRSGGVVTGEIRAALDRSREWAERQRAVMWQRKVEESSRMLLGDRKTRMEPHSG